MLYIGTYIEALFNPNDITNPFVFTFYCFLCKYKFMKLSLTFCFNLFPLVLAAFILLISFAKFSISYFDGF